MAKNTEVKNIESKKSGKPSEETVKKVTKKRTTASTKGNGKVTKPIVPDSSKMAVVEVNGTQILVQEGKKYEMNKLVGEKGSEIEITQVLLYSNGTDVKIGRPFIEGAKVIAKIDSQKKGDKLKVFKYKAKARYRRTYGSRPLITRLEIVQITA